jgi:hypothetical protein
MSAGKAVRVSVGASVLRQSPWAKPDKGETRGEGAEPGQLRRDKITHSHRSASAVFTMACDGSHGATLHRLQGAPWGACSNKAVWRTTRTPTVIHLPRDGKSVCGSAVKAYHPGAFCERFPPAVEGARRTVRSSLALPGIICCAPRHVSMSFCTRLVRLLSICQLASKPAMWVHVKRSDEQRGGTPYLQRRRGKRYSEARRGRQE